MTLDLTAWGASSDPYRNPIPTPNDDAIEYWIVGAWGTYKTTVVTCSTPSLFVLNSARKDNDVRFVSQSDPTQILRPKENGDGIVPLDEFDYIDKNLRIYPFANQEELEEFVGFGLARWLKIRFPKGGSGTFDLEISVPYAWLEVDLAELVFVWTRFYSGGGIGALDLLHRDALIAYSERQAWDNFARGRVSVYRVVEKTLAQMLKPLIASSWAVAIFSGHNATDGWRPLFALRHFDELFENEEIYQLDPGEDPFVVGTPIVRSADDASFNRLNLRWGRAVRCASTNRYGSPEYGNLQEPISPGEDDSILRQDDATSQASIGLRPEARNIVDAVDHQNAEGIFQVERYSKVQREIEVALGPKHFDFEAGEIIHARALKLGFTGEERLFVKSKTINWDTLLATVQAVEIDDPELVVAPDEVETADLVGWFSADSGVSVAYPAGTVAHMNDRSGYTSGLGTPPRGTAVPPGFLGSYRNGLDAIDFRKTLSLDPPKGLDWPHWASSPSEASSWTFVCCYESRPPLSSTVRSAILSTNGIGNGPLEFDHQKGGSSPSLLGFYDGLVNWGPAAIYGTVVVFFQIYNDRASWAQHDGNRIFIRAIQLGGSLQDHLKESNPADTTVFAYADDRRGFGGVTAVGCDCTMLADAWDCIGFEWFLFEHRKAVPTLRSRELRGLLNYLRRWTP